MKRIQPIFAGYNKKGMFIVDEDTQKGKYTTDEKISQLQYKINQLVSTINEMREEQGKKE